MSVSTGRVEGKVAFITGAARGQGRSARRAARAGGRRHHRRRHLQADRERGVSGGHTCRPRRDRRSCRENRQAHRLRRGGRSGLRRAGGSGRSMAWNNWAASTSSSPTRASATWATGCTRSPENIWQDMIDVNLTGVWKTVKAGVPHLISGGRGGSVIMTSSVGGMKALPTPVTISPPSTASPG